MDVFTEIKTGLAEAIEYEKGSLEAETTTLSIDSVKTPPAAKLSLQGKETTQK